MNLRWEPSTRARASAVTSPLLQALVVTVLVAAFTFFLVRFVLGDPAQVLIGGHTGASPERVAALRSELGLDRPVLTQFGHYLASLTHGDLGDSFEHPGTPVAAIVADGASVTGALVATSAVISVALGVGTGLAAAVIRSRILDTVLRVISLIGLAAPGALVGLVLILTVALNGGMLPAGGWSDSFPDNVRYLILPSVTVSFWLAPIIFRAVRERASAVLGESFVEAAAVRGHSTTQIVVRHVVPNCVGPVVTVIAVSLSYLISGAVIVEIIFGLPGIGRALTTAVGSSDFPVIQGIVLATGATVVIINLGAEIAGRAIDPRAGAR